MSWTAQATRKFFRLSCALVMGCLAGRFAPAGAAASVPFGAAVEIQAPVHGGSIEGQVNVAPPVRKIEPLPVFKNREFCGDTVINETLLVRSDGGVQNAVVLLHPLRTRAETHPGFLTLDNKNCRFLPHVQIATVGSELLLTNSDPILHTVHARLASETLFNVGLPIWRRVTKKLDRAGVIRIDCDVLHTWMSAAIVVTDTPYYALSDDAGRFKIERLPAGDYRMEVWHERLGLRRVIVSVGLNASTRVEVIYSAAKLR